MSSDPKQREPAYAPHEIRWTAEKSKRLWDYYGSQPSYATAFFGRMAGAYVAKEMFRRVPLTAGAHLLDVSCGRGDVLAECLKRMSGEQKIWATDFTDTYVDMVNRRFTSDFRFKGARLTTTFPSSYDAGTFDVVFATEVIEHLNDGELDGLLAECRRLLKPGGFVLFTTPNNEDYDASKMMCPDCGCIFHKWQHVRVWTPSTLKAYVEPHGFATTYLSPIAWQSWKGKLLSIARTGKINKSGLLYVGQRSS